MMIKSYRKWSICTFPSFLLISNSPFCPPPISSNSMLSFSPLVCFSTCFFSFSFRFLSCCLPSSLFPLSHIFPSLLCLYSLMFFPFPRSLTPCIPSSVLSLSSYSCSSFLLACFLSRQSNKPAFLISPSQLCSSEVFDSTILPGRRKEKGGRGEEGGGKKEARKCVRPRRSEGMGVKERQKRNRDYEREY